MANGMKTAQNAMEDLLQRKKNGEISPKEENLIPILEICIEMYARGISFVPVDLYRSHAVNFLDVEEGILAPLNALPGSGGKCGEEHYGGTGKRGIPHRGGFAAAHGHYEISY